MNTSYYMGLIRSGLVAVVFAVLFVVFLIKSIQRGNKIRELEDKIKRMQDPTGQGMPPFTPTGMPYIQMPYPPYQAPVQQPIENTPYQAPVQVPVQAPVQTSCQAPVQAAVNPAAQAPIQAPAVQPVFAPAAQAPIQAPASQPVFAPADQAPTPSWATPPSAAQRPQPAAPAVPEPAPRQKFFSSINITFGIGVLLLTIVGATFMTGSWDWMTEEIRAISLVILVFLVYGMSFLAGKVLKLQQTGFALYSLASLLGPIVIVGMGSFELLGPGFSFHDGSGWLVATVASMVLLISSLAGRFIFKDEKNQANVYQGTTYIALTWLVVFLSAQIGQSSEVVNEWSMILLGLSTLALAFRIVDMTKIFSGEKFFRVYSEVILYIPAGLLTFSIALSDGALFGAAIIVFIAFVLFAKFREGRQWVKYLTPVVGMLMAVCWCVFEGGEEMYLMTAVMMVIIFVVYAVHKVFGLSSGLSEIGLPVSLGLVTALIALEDIPGMGAAACFITLAIFLFQLVVEPVLAKNESLPEGIFNGADSIGLKIAVSILGAVFYYLGMFMIFLTIENPPFKGHLFFTLAALIPAIAAVVIRIVWKDDIRIRMSGLVMVITAAFAAFLSCFSFDTTANAMYYRDDICAWILPVAIINMAVFFLIRALKEKRFSIGVMLWAAVCLNALASGVFTFIEYREGFFGADTSGASFILARQIASGCFLALNMAAVAAAFFLKRRKEGLIAEYAKGMRYVFTAVACHWFVAEWVLIGSNWKILIISVIFAALLTIFDLEFFTLLPVLAAEFAIISEIGWIENGDVKNVLMIALTIAFAGSGRLIFRKKVISPKAVDYLSLTSFIPLFGLHRADYLVMMIFLTLALLVMNFAGRVKIPVRVLLSIFASFVCMALVAQPFFSYPDFIELEVNMILLLGTLLLICRLIKPAPANVLKYLWFTGVALCIVTEGVSAAVTHEVFDLILVGAASFGIFIYAFIRRNRLWFILGVISMISVAVYLSLAFWSSLVWLIYLLVAGVILVVMAAVNEWGKRHNKEGKNKRFFQEWTW